MSYWFQMTFWREPKKTVLDTCVSIMDYFRDKDHAMAWIKENIDHAPSNVYDHMVKDDHDKRIMKVADEEWIYNLFNFQFVHWPQFDTMGFLGELPKDLKLPGARRPVTIEFQNSTDQDYDLLTWMDVPAFKNIALDICKLAVKNDCKLADKAYHENPSEEGYRIRSDIYDKIYEDFNLNDWLYKRSGNFKSFAMSAVNGYTERVELWFLLKSILHHETE